MTPETTEAVQATLRILKAGDGTRRHGELLERVIAELTAERDRLKGLLSGSQQELRDAITAQGRAERERDEALATIDRVRALAEEMAGLAPDDDWGDDVPSTIGADVARRFLAALDGSGT